MAVPEHATPLLHCQVLESLWVQMRLLRPKIELQLCPAHVSFREKLPSVSQNMYVPFVVVMIATDLRASRGVDK